MYTEYNLYLKAHARARFVLMRLLELEGNGLLTVSEVEPGKNLLLTLQKDRLATDGKKIIGKSYWEAYERGHTSEVIIFLNG